MAEDKDESQKTEEPTQKKLQDAQEKGEVAKSQEIRHWFVLFAISLIILISAKPSMTAIGNLLKTVLEKSYRTPMDAYSISDYLTGIMKNLFSYMTLPIIIIMLGALLGAIIQHKPVFSPEKIKPKLNKISPLAGFKRLFSAQNFFEISKSVLKLIIVGTVVLILVWPERSRLEQMASLDLANILNILFIMVMRIMMGVVAIMAIIAGLDFLFQKQQFIKKMRMTKQEVKDEMKQTEGDPQVRSRLRQIRQDRARNRMMSAVPESSVVVTNPTHYSVALKYDPDNMAVPVVIAKGADHIALKIREVASEHHIPVLESPPLARTLFDSVELDEEIHEDHYKAVAEIISYIMRLKKGEPATYNPSTTY